MAHTVGRVCASGAGCLLRWLGVFLALSCLASATELTRAIRLEDAPAVEAALKSGKDINTLDAEALSPLFYAVVAGRPDWVKALLAQGARPDDERQRFTPLRAAASKGDVESARLLLEGGAKVGSAQIKGKDMHPASAAIRSGSVEVLKLLLEKEPKLDLDKVYRPSSSPSSASPVTVMNAVVNRHADMALFLINHGCLTTWSCETAWFNEAEEVNGQDETPVLVAALESGPLFDPVVDRLIAMGQPPVRRRFVHNQSLDAVPPWDGLTAAVREGNLKRAAQFMPEPMDLERPYRLFLLRYAQNCGNPAMLDFVKKRLGGELRPKPGVPKGYTEPPSDDPDIRRMLVPRRSKGPALKEPKAPVTVAVISSPGAENAGESLSALLPSLPGWKVVERGTVEALLREKEFQAPWGDGTKDLTSVGDKLTAETLLLVTKVGETKPALLRLEVVDVRTGLALRRMHVSMEKFQPQEFTKEIAAEVVAARERFAASGGRITAVSVLDIGARVGTTSSGGLASLVGLGLKEEIDNTAGAVAMTRNQMQPLMEEKVLAGSQSLWGAAWSLEGGLQMATGERVKLELRATNLQDGKKVDVAVEGAVSDPRALVREAWAKVREKAGILGAAATPDPGTAKHEAEGLVAEAEWLMVCSRPAEAARAVDAAFYLGADPDKVIPLRIRTHCQALPDASWEGRKTPLYPEFSPPLMSLRMLARMPEFMALAELVDRSLAEYPEVLKKDLHRSDSAASRYAFDGVWEAMSRLITYRLSLPEIELTPEEVQSFREFDRILNRVEERLFALLPGTANEVDAILSLADWLRGVDLARIPHFRERLIDWVMGLIERGGPPAEYGADIIGRIVNNGGLRLGRIATLGGKLQPTDRMELAKTFQDRLGKSSHPCAPFWRASLNVWTAAESEKGKAMQQILIAAMKLAEDGHPPGAERLSMVGRAGVVDYPNFKVLPASVDSILPELVRHPRLCGEFIDKASYYFVWIRKRNDVAKGERKWLADCIDYFPKSQNRRPENENPVTHKELLLLSSRESIDARGMFDWISRVVDLPQREAQALQKIIASQPDLAPDVRNFGAHELVPEIRFRHEIQPVKRVAMLKRDEAVRFIAYPKSMAQDKAAKLLWIGGVTGRAEDFRETPNIDVKQPTFEPLLIRYDLESETLTEFRPPVATQPGGDWWSQIAVADGFCVLQAKQHPIFAAPAKGDKAFDWGPEIKALNFVSYQGSAYATVKSIGNVGTEERDIRRMYRLTPGQPAVLLADAARRPEQSPLDNPRFVFGEVVVQDERVVLFASTQDSRGVTRGGRTYGAYNPKDGSWKSEEGAEAEQRWKRDYTERWRSEQGSFLAANGPYCSFKLSDGSEVSMPHIHIPGQLVLLPKASGVRQEDIFVPIALDLPAEFARRFYIKLPDDRSPPVFTEDSLTAAECIRSGFVRPVTVAQTDAHVILAARFKDHVPFPYLWYISKADIERNLKEQMAKRK